MKLGPTKKIRSALTGPVVTFVGIILLAIVNHFRRGNAPGRSKVANQKGTTIKEETGDETRDPVAGALGARPADTGIGTIVAGAAARAAVGNVVEPVGSVGGELAGRGAAAATDATRAVSAIT